MGMLKRSVSVLQQKGHPYLGVEHRVNTAQPLPHWEVMFHIPGALPHCQGPNDSLLQVCSSPLQEVEVHLKPAQLW